MAEHMSDLPPEPLTRRLFDDADAAPLDPFALFEEWFASARAAEPNDPNAMALATVDADGLPDVRMVLLNGRDGEGFTFFTNAGSAKGVQLAARPAAALLFHWKSLRRQIRLRGPVRPAADSVADAYFASRPRPSRIASAASDQSRPLKSRAALEARVAALAGRIGDADIARPPHWTGYRLVPESIEFWKDGAHRLHDRVRFARAAPDGAWSRTRLYP